MTQDEALKKMQEIDDMRAILTQAHSRLNLIAAGTIETPEEIAVQAAKADAAVEMVSIDAVKEINVKGGIDIEPVLDAVL